MKRVFVVTFKSGRRMRVRAKDCEIQRSYGQLSSVKFVGLRTWGPRKYVCFFRAEEILFISVRFWL